MNTNGKTLLAATTPPFRGESEIGDLEARHARDLATFAHDLRSPLSSIRTGIEVLKISLDNPQQVEKIIALLERQTLEIARLLEGLVASSPVAAQDEPPSLTASAETSGPSRKVLVVDDSRSASDILTLFFKMEGFEVRSAYLGENAIEVANEMQPDVVFLDLGLPDMSGYEVAMKIRKLSFGDQCFIVALTGRDREEDRKNIAEAGFDLHVVKPPEPGLLREVLQKSAARVR